MIEEFEATTEQINNENGSQIISNKEVKVLIESMPELRKFYQELNSEQQ